jgi:ABC-2 type transport system ATP-binding protein
VTGLVKHYGEVTAVADVSLQAAAGEITAVLGPNGAGKTTTIEICAGLRAADGGSVTVLGTDPHRAGPALKARVGVMPQGGSTASGVYPAARVGEVVQLYADLHTQPLPAGPLLERLGLARVVRTPWRRLSGGEQQRLSLALAVIGRPEVIFLDEPTSGLDVEGRRATWELIDELRTAGVAVVLTTHALDEAEQLADVVVIVSAGRVVASGSPTSLTHADGPTTQLRFSAVPSLPLDDLLTALPGGLTAAEPSPGSYEVDGDITPGLVAAVTSWCAARGVMPDQLRTTSRSLEDVFVALTGEGHRP